MLFIFEIIRFICILFLNFLAVILFLGGWNSPFPSVGSINLSEWTSGGGDSIAHITWGAFWILTKSWLLMASHVWIRWTLPRLRVDQLMKLCWKILTPLSLVFFVLACFWRLLM